MSEELEPIVDREFRRYASSRFSFTDCTTKVLMERESIDTAFAFDRDLEVLWIPSDSVIRASATASPERMGIDATKPLGGDPAMFDKATV